MGIDQVSQRITMRLAMLVVAVLRMAAVAVAPARAASTGADLGATRTPAQAVPAAGPYSFVHRSAWCLDGDSSDVYLIPSCIMHWGRGANLELIHQPSGLRLAGGLVAGVHLATCDGSVSQQWEKEFLGDISAVKHVGTGRCLGASRYSIIEVFLSLCTGEGTLFQDWSLS